MREASAMGPPWERILGNPEAQYKSLGVGGCSQPRQMLQANLLRGLVEFGRSLAQPDEGFLAYGVVFGVAGLHIGFVQRIEPRAMALLIAGPGRS